MTTGAGAWFKRVFNRHSLRFQLMVYFLAVSVLSAVVGSYTIYTSVTGQLQRQSEALVLQQFAQARQGVENLYTETNRIANTFLMSDEAQAFYLQGVYAPTFDDVQRVSGVYKKAGEILSNYSFIDSIYLFSMDRVGVGYSRRYTMTAGSNGPPHPFFETGLYDAYMDGASYNTWSGAFTQAFFNDLVSVVSGVDEPLISQITQASNFANPARKGILVFNISERYLASLYSVLDSEEGSTTYIIDGDGAIVSAADPQLIGGGSEVAGHMDAEAQHGSLALHLRGAQHQVVYYRLPEINWYIVREIPLQAVTGYAVSALLTFMLVAVCISVLIVMAASFFWLRRIVDPLQNLAEKMIDVGHGNLGLDVDKVPGNEIGDLIVQFNKMSKNIAGLMLENERIEAEKHRHEVAALQAQINPHFLYNTLNMIKWMAVSVKAQNIVDSLVAVGNILQPVFQSSGAMWALGQETVYLENYAAIMNWRYNNAIRFRMSVEDGLLSCMVPRFILQPLVENAVVHGLKQTGAEEETGLDIRVEIFKSGPLLVIEVHDSGNGMDEETLRRLNALIAEQAAEPPAGEPDTGRSVGLPNVARRIRLHYGALARLSITSVLHGGSTIHLAFPAVPGPGAP